jgi:Glycosyl transferases group 1/Glycosyltransferase Family 4
LNICWLIPDDRGGGVASVALSCVRQAHASGHQATLLLALASTGWLDHEDQEDFLVDSLGLEPPARDAPAAILQWLRAHPQDFLVLNGCEQADAVIPYLPCTVRAVYVVHDTARRYWAPALRHEAVLDAIVAVSHTVGKQFDKRLQNPSKLRVIHNGSRFAPRPKSVTGRASDMLLCCGDNPTKGAYDALRLWRRLAQAGFKGDLHWFGRMEPRFERRVRTLPENNRVHLYGRRARSEIFATATRCRVLLMLSRVEPFGMTTVEAMSMGCLPVAWDIDTGTREIVNHDENGFFTPLGDTAALLDTVLRAIEAQPKLGLAAMKRARSDFDEKTMWRGYAKLFTELEFRPLSIRPSAGQAPPDYFPKSRFFQRFPASWRASIRACVGRSPRLGYWLRDLRGL